MWRRKQNREQSPTVTLGEGSRSLSDFYVAWGVKAR